MRPLPYAAIDEPGTGNDNSRTMRGMHGTWRWSWGSASPAPPRV
jgi:hypothetical protein